MSDRVVLSLTGTDRVDFLQGLVTNDVTKADGSIIYTALLTPQGKFLADFFVLGRPDELLLDVDQSLAPLLTQRLTMYRLRADVQIKQTAIIVSRGTREPRPDGALTDPRHPALGWRVYGSTDMSDTTDWDALRVAHLIPASGIELTPESYILEAGFERLNGVDFRKGCFVGQEIVARMKHKTTLRKGLVRLALSGPAEPGDEILADDEKPVGILHTVSGENAIGFVRFDRSEQTLFIRNAKARIVD